MGLQTQSLKSRTYRGGERRRSKKTRMIKPYTRFRSQGQVKKRKEEKKERKRPTVAASLMLVVYLVIDIIKH